VCKAMQQAGLKPGTTQVLVLHPKTLSEVLHSITAIGTAAGVPDRAQQLVTQLQDRLRAAAAAVQACSPAAAAQTVALASIAASDLPDTSVQQQQQRHKSDTLHDCRTGQDAAAAQESSTPQQQQQQQRAPRVLSLEGLNPLVLGGQWLPDVKLAAGAVDASGQRPGDPPTRITWEQVRPFEWKVLTRSGLLLQTG
jgi:ABC-type hemin transport system substrate-binding protein